MKYLRRTINLAYFIGIVTALTVATVYVLALTGSALINGFKSLSAEDWLHYLVLCFIIAPLWRNINKLYKPIIKPDSYENF